MSIRERDHDANARHLMREAVSVTVSYHRTEDDCVAVLVGYGDNFEKRMADADAQLPHGTWTRECVSTPASIYMDLRGRHDQRTENVLDARTRRSAAFSRYEGKIVHA